MSRQSDDMTDNARQKVKSIGQAVIWIAVSAIVTLLVTGWINNYKEVKQTAFDATYMTTGKAQEIHGEIKDEYRSLINETRNIETKHYEKTEEKLDKIQSIQMEMLLNSRYIVKAIKGE